MSCSSRPTWAPATAANRAASKACARAPRSTPSCSGNSTSRADGQVSIEAIIARYGVVAVFAGAGFEGETAAVAGGLLAHQGYFALPSAMAAAAAGSLVADQIFFLLGRRFRAHRW